MDIQAMARVKSALAIIDEQVLLPWSEEQEAILRSAYDVLRWQCSPLGVGIEPAREGTAEIIFQGAENFKWRLDKRYPGWRSMSVDEVLADVSEAYDVNTVEEDSKDVAPEERIITGLDCRCTNHSGPHWLYKDYQWHERNLKHLERCRRHVQRFYELYLIRNEDTTAFSRGLWQRQGAEQAYRAFALEEFPRIQEKIWHMETSKTKRISYEVLGSGFEDLDERERACRAAIIEILQKIPEDK